MPKQPSAYVLHALPRRVHVRAPALSRHRDACERIARELAREPGWDRVSVRERTGSVVVECEDGVLDAHAIARRASEMVEAMRDEGILDNGRQGRTGVAAALVRAASAINDDVSASLDHHADLGTLMPVTFALGGLVEIAATGKIPMPPWFNLFWWSLRSFMTFNHPVPDLDEADGKQRERGEPVTNAGEDDNDAGDAP